jgi:hypothetical protein
VTEPEPKNPDDRRLLQELQMIAAMRRDYMPPHYVYSCIEDFLLHHGTFFTPHPLQLPLKPMRLGQCFENAYRLASRAPNAYHYVEGLALSIVSTPHAWVIDRQGTVIDPTWTDGMLGTSYCGVELSLDVVRESRRHGSLTVLADLRRRHPALTGADVFASDAWFPKGGVA